MPDYTQLTTTQAKSASKALMKEAVQLSPSAVISMFEIDLSDILEDNQFIFSKTTENEHERILRFHNSQPYLSQRKSIIWRGDQYYPAPFKMGGFESTMQGTLPKPKMGLAVNDSSVNALAILKSKIRVLDDFVGAKVTRYKTFAKFLDFENFAGGEAPQGFAPDTKAEFPREIYYIERKSTENKYVIEFELASKLDVEGVRIPRRIIMSERCPWSYRGEGCCYEYADRITSVHGDKTIASTFKAVPKATEIGVEFRNLLSMSEDSFIDKGDWKPNIGYSKGEFVYVQKDLVKYYFIAKGDIPKGTKPPNQEYWLADECTKDVRGCRLRYRNSALPFGGFPSAQKQRAV